MYPKLLIYLYPTFPFDNQKFVFMCMCFSVLSVSLFVSCFLRFHMLSYIILYLSFSVWLTSFCMIISRSINVAANDIYSFLTLNNIPLCMCVCMCIYIYIYIYTYIHTKSSLSIHLLIDVYVVSMS